MLRIRVSESNTNYIFISSDIRRYDMILPKQFSDIFLPKKYKYVFVNEDEEADICIVGLDHTNNDLLRKNEINILISVENLLLLERDFYQHANTFGRYNNDMIDMYIYNDITSITNNAIPLIYLRLLYFKSIENNYKMLNTNFKDKLFCLFVSRNRMNLNKNEVLNKLSDLGQIDFLDKYDDIIKNKTCYNDIDLLQIFNKYKFIICFENSKGDSYITEKIFNVFLSNSIPIYDGPNNINDYIYKESYLQYDNNLFDNVKDIMRSHVLYNNVINNPKIKPIDPIVISKMENYLDNMIIKKKINIDKFSNDNNQNIEKFSNKKNYILVTIIFVLVLILIIFIFYKINK